MMDCISRETLQRMLQTRPQTLKTEFVDSRELRGLMECSKYMNCSIETNPLNSSDRAKST